MVETRILMGMHITVEIVGGDSLGAAPARAATENVFAYFNYIDEKFSTYKNASEIVKVNNGELPESAYSEDMKTVLALSEKTKKETDGYFDIRTAGGSLDPSGLVKGWAIHNAANILAAGGFKNFYIDAGGDIQVSGHNEKGAAWSVGIKNPFNQKEIVKVLYAKGNEGIATSGTYIRGEHIYNPKHSNEPATEIVSLTVVGPNVYEADRFATAAFAMGKEGISFIENLPGFEGYIIGKDGVATMTSGFETYTQPHA